MQKKMIVNGREYDILKLLGKGKGGYSYLASDGTGQYNLRVDFECNEYMDEWNFENWGAKYWSKTPEFLQYMKDSLQ